MITEVEVPCTETVHTLHLLVSRSNEIRLRSDDPHPDHRWVAYGFGDRSAVPCAATADTTHEMWAALSPSHGIPLRMIRCFVVAAHWYTHHRTRAATPVEVWGTAVACFQAGYDTDMMWDRGPGTNPGWLGSTCWRSSTDTRRVLLPEPVWDQLTITRQRRPALSRSPTRCSTQVQ